MLKHGDKLYYLGKEVTVCHVLGRGISEVKDTGLCIYGSVEFLPRRVQDFYKREANTIIPPMVRNFTKILGVSYNNITFKDTKTRWGSASSNGNLSFSWRIVMADLHIIEYVVAHEVSHLVEMNHSKRFWEVCKQICPSYKARDFWLKQNGHIFLFIEF